MLVRNVDLNQQAQTAGPVIYWMSRDQRVDDNWALLYAQSQALAMQQSLVVVFCKIKAYLGSTPEIDAFMMTGLRQAALKLKDLKIPFVLLEGEPVEELDRFATSIQAGLVVTDFNPLRISRSWKTQLAAKLQQRLLEVDAHNVIPCFLASPKQEFAAYTFRPKYHKKLDEYLSEFPALIRHPFPLATDIPESEFAVATAAGFIEAGEAAARAQLIGFLSKRLEHYDQRNDPNEDACSGLSPYLHFGQISAQRVALEVRAKTDKADEFLEELLLRRELADNFCHYNQNYDNPDGFPDWARKTIAEHRRDPRTYLYSLEQLEQAETHDALWNAAQMEMVKTQKMHGYLRMYWAKKILEWSESAEQAMAYAILLNDKYSLDGRDPNGYTGIAWSIGGVHDRAWGERAVFGKIRYMSYEGCRRKFDVERYIQWMNAL